MRPLELVAIIVLTGAVVGCGTSFPAAAPTPAPTATTWTLSGSVSSSIGFAITSATLTILDGPDNGKQTETDSVGRYSFAGLQQAGFTLRASAFGYAAISKGVTLTANTVTDFQLPRPPVAVLTHECHCITTMFAPNISSVTLVRPQRVERVETGCAPCGQPAGDQYHAGRIG